MLRGRGPSFLGKLHPPLGYVWGEPIKVKQQTPVEPEYLDQVHAEVMKSVRSIFDRYKTRFGYDEDEKLTMVTVQEAKDFVSTHKRKTGDSSAHRVNKKE